MTPKHRPLFGNLEQFLSISSAAIRPDDSSLEVMQRRLFADFCRMLNGSLDARDSDTATAQKVAALAPRARQTLERLLVGDSEKQIARKLGVSQNTIHVYVKNIYRAFAVSSRGELMTHFLSNRWLITSPGVNN